MLSLINEFIQKMCNLFKSNPFTGLAIVKA